MKPIFVSYSRRDKDLLDQLTYTIEYAGFPLWVDRSNIRGGDDWAVELRKAVAGASKLLLFLSPASAISPYVRDELRWAREAGVPIVVLQIKDTQIEKGLQGLLADAPLIQWATSLSDIFSSFNAVFDALDDPEQPVSDFRFTAKTFLQMRKPKKQGVEPASASAKIVLGFTTDDADDAKKLAEALAKEGYHLSLGLEELGVADICIFLISPAAVKDAELQMQWEAATKAATHLLPVMVWNTPAEDWAAFPSLGDRQWINLADDLEVGIERLRDTLRDREAYSTGPDAERHIQRLQRDERARTSKTNRVAQYTLLASMLVALVGGIFKNTSVLGIGFAFAMLGGGLFFLTGQAEPQPGEAHLAPASRDKRIPLKKLLTGTNIGFALVVLGFILIFAFANSSLAQYALPLFPLGLAILFISEWWKRRRK